MYIYIYHDQIIMSFRFVLFCVYECLPACKFVYHRWPSVHRGQKRECFPVELITTL